MLTGIVNQESLPQLLQSIAHRRKQGDLEVTLVESVVKISFIQGKIVEYSDGPVAPATEVYGIMKRTGVFKPEAPEFAGGNYTELLKYSEENWAGQGSATDTLKSAVKKRLLDKLHPFAIESTVPWGFRVGGVGIDRSIALGTSVSQLLLDWAEVDAVWEQWEVKVQPESRLSRAKELAGTPGPDESALLTHLEQERSIIELEGRTFLDTLAFRQAVLKLLESGGVLMQNPAAAPPASAPVQPEQASTADATAVSSELPADGDSVPAKPMPKPQRQRRAKKPKPKKETTSDIVPHVLALVMLICAIVLPFFFWQEAFTQF